MFPSLAELCHEFDNIRIAWKAMFDHSSDNILLYIRYEVTKS